MKTETIVFILAGPHKGKFGWLRQSWNDCETAMKNYGLYPSQHKVFVHGLGAHAVAMRFAKIREATALEICLWEQEKARGLPTLEGISNALG